MGRVIFAIKLMKKLKLYTPVALGMRLLKQKV